MNVSNFVTLKKRYHNEMLEQIFSPSDVTEVMLILYWYDTGASGFVYSSRLIL